MFNSIRWSVGQQHFIRDRGPIILLVKGQKFLTLHTINLSLVFAQKGTLLKGMLALETFQLNVELFDSCYIPETLTV